MQIDKKLTISNEKKLSKQLQCWKNCRVIKCTRWKNIYACGRNKITSCNPCKLFRFLCFLGQSGKQKSAKIRPTFKEKAADSYHAWLIINCHCCYLFTVCRIVIGVCRIAFRQCLPDFLHENPENYLNYARNHSKTSLLFRDVITLLFEGVM